MPSTPLIETEPLRLRAVTGDDLDELVRLHDDPLVTRRAAGSSAALGLGDPVTVWATERR